MKRTNYGMRSGREGRRQLNLNDAYFDYWSGTTPFSSASLCFRCGDPNNLEQAHLTAHTYYGECKIPNIVLLCHGCHRLMDDVFMGYPNEKNEQLEWIKNGYQDELDRCILLEAAVLKALGLIDDLHDNYFLPDDLLPWAMSEELKSKISRIVGSSTYLGRNSSRLEKMRNWKVISLLEFVKMKMNVKNET